MPNVTYKITPTLNKVAKGYANAGDSVLNAVRKAIETVAFTVESYSKQVTPVDTGRLRGSISVSMPMGSKGTVAEVGTHNVRYAVFVHEGTGRMKARPFMEHGLNFAIKKLNGEIKGRLDRGLRESLSKL